MEPTTLHWAGFSVFVAVALGIDLAVFHRHTKDPTLRESARGTVIWCALALAFNGLIAWWFGQTAAVGFLNGYLVEWSLSMDNVFIFAVIFNFFRVPLKFQHRVLFWGILGAIAMRLSFILAGAQLLTQFEWITWIFGLILIYTAVKLALHSGGDVHPDHNILMRLAKKVFPVAQGDHGRRFFAVENGRRCITPLFLVLLVIESTDVVFAVDSVPAILGLVDHDLPSFRFVCFTSNVFAILGLRSLYFLLAGVMDIFRYLNYGLAAVLTFVGLKMIAEQAVHLEILADQPWAEHLTFFQRHSWASLAVIVSLLGIAVVASIIAHRREQVAPRKSADSAE